MKLLTLPVKYRQLIDFRACSAFHKFIPNVTNVFKASMTFPIHFAYTPRELHICSLSGLQSNIGVNHRVCFGLFKTCTYF